MKQVASNIKLSENTSQVRELNIKSISYTYWTQYLLHWNRCEDDTVMCSSGSKIYSEIFWFVYLVFGFLKILYLVFGNYRFNVLLGMFWILAPPFPNILYPPLMCNTFIPQKHPSKTTNSVKLHNWFKIKSKFKKHYTERTNSLIT